VRAPPIVLVDLLVGQGELEGIVEPELAFGIESRKQLQPGRSEIDHRPASNAQCLCGRHNMAMCISAWRRSRSRTPNLPRGKVTG
jgi:hypothetical protein